VKIVFGGASRRCAGLKTAAALTGLKTGHYNFGPGPVKPFAAAARAAAPV